MTKNATSFSKTECSEEKPKRGRPPGPAHEYELSDKRCACGRGFRFFWTTGRLNGTCWPCSSRKSSEDYALLQKLVVAALGGRCSVPGCEETEDLEFDHIDPMTKSWDLSQGKTHSPQKINRELQKMRLLCRPHHGAKTAEDTADHTARRALEREQLGKERSAKEIQRQNREAEKLVPLPAELDGPYIVGPIWNDDLREWNLARGRVQVRSQGALLGRGGAKRSSVRDVAAVAV